MLPGTAAPLRFGCRGVVQHSRSSSHASHPPETTDREDAVPVQQSAASEATAAPAASQIDLARRVVPVADVPDDVCSICLDEFSSEDPAQETDCG